MGKAQARFHELRTLPEYFLRVADGTKSFEVRRDDRIYAVGDRLWLREWSEDQGYSGRDQWAVVTYILQGGQFGVEPGYVVLAIRLEA